MLFEVTKYFVKGPLEDGELVEKREFQSEKQAESYKKLVNESTKLNYIILDIKKLGGIL
jgi:hypothetical protein